MKKILLLLIISITPFFSTYATETVTGIGTLNTITEMINSMAGYGILDADVAKAKISYFNDKIFLYGTELSLVLKESEDWARAELWKITSKKLLSLKDQGFLTNEEYETYIKSYSGTITSRAPLLLGVSYKDFTRFEKESIDTAIPRRQEALYNKFKTKLTELLKANRITQEKHDAWLVKIGIQVYQYKSDPDFMASEFDEEAARYTAILPPSSCTSCSTNCSSNCSTTSTTTTSTTTSTDYSKEVQTQYGKQYSKMSLKNLQATLVRTAKIEKKYKTGTKNQLKTKAMIDLINKEIAKKSTILALIK